MDELLNEFLTETSESIDTVDVQLVILERDPNNKEVLDNIFRLVHTIKGTCGFLGLPRLESVAHASENVLGKFRDGELEVTQNAVTVILESLDCIKEILSGLEATEEEPDGDDSDLIGRLDMIAEGKSTPEVSAATDEPDTVDGEIVDTTLGRTLKAGEVTLEELEAAFDSAPGPEELEAQTPEEQVSDFAGATSGQESGGGKSEDSLFNRIGRDDTISVVAHLIATRVEHQNSIKDFFEGDKLEQRKGRFQGLLLALVKDEMEAAETVSRQLIKVSGFEDKHFTSLLGLIKECLIECGVEGETADEAVMTFELVREAVLTAAKAVATASQAPGKEAGDTAGAAAGGESKRANQSIRVSVDLLEDLMNMVSELVLTRNQLLQIVRNIDNAELAVPLQRLSQCTTELQENVMKTRMQPIGNAWAKLPRIVRDLTVELDKKIELDMRGADTELDRQVLELIKDPLTHMVRNSADHGVETPAERIANGKPEVGNIILNAYHEGGHIILEIKDDGRGIPVGKLKSKILEKGLASETEIAEMSDNQVQKFIFHPGFSTAAKITNVSGRGVGMDVVRSNIEKIGGTIDMVSIEGKGTTFQIKIPLTLAIVAAMIVEASGERYAIPQISVLELVRASNDGEYRIEKINETPVLRLRNRLLPLVYLNEVLGFKDHIAAETEDLSGFIVVTQVGAFNFGIVVDQVFDTEEIVVKPVAPILKHLEVYSGNTILGDGSVIMILDPNGVATVANAGLSEHGHEEEEKLEARRQTTEDKESMLLFRAGDVQPKAVPLAVVARLEDIPIEEIEEADGKLVVQYRGALMPVVKAQEDLKLASEGRQPILVFSDRDQTMGLAVDEILDIVEETLEIKLSSATPGVVGSSVIAGKATEIIDVSHYLGLAFSGWHKRREMNEQGLVDDLNVLLVDDSDFFRSMLRPLLTAAGFHVTAVSSAQMALNLKEQNVHFDLIISDIEMPEMNGYEMARIIKSGGPWQDTPLIALSALASEKDINRGRDAGFDDYVAKFDKETLLTSIIQQLHIKGDAA